MIASVNAGWANNCGVQLFTIGWVPCPTAEEEQPSGGYEYWIRYEQEYYRRKEEEKRRRKALKKAKKIKNKLDRELAIEQRKIEAEDARKAELTRLLRLTEQFIDELSYNNDRMREVIQAASDRQTFSTMERMEREITRMREEEEFMLNAISLLIH